MYVTVCSVPGADSVRCLTAAYMPQNATGILTHNEILLHILCLDWLIPCVNIKVCQVCPGLPASGTVLTAERSLNLRANSPRQTGLCIKVGLCDDPWLCRLTESGFSCTQLPQWELRSMWLANHIVFGALKHLRVITRLHSFVCCNKTVGVLILFTLPAKSSSSQALNVST